jgi:hypothetical protein
MFVVLVLTVKIEVLLFLVKEVEFIIDKIETAC